MTKMIDLEVLTEKGRVRNLAGKDRGISARKELNLDALDEAAESVAVRVPDFLYAISSSFFLGLFSESIAKFGSKDAFLQKYQFDADESIMKQVIHGIERGLMTRTGFSETQRR